MKTEGILLIDKTLGITSFDVVAGLRPILGTSRVGHCGTLDPMATGLLVACFGKATKLTRFLTKESKRYVARIRLGIETTTYDRYGPQVTHAEPEEFDIMRLKEEMSLFEGEYNQTVPSHSALKHKGKRLYKYARASQEVPSLSRTVMIESIELLDYEHPFVTIDATCSTGTYIRSIAHDLGQRLGCGATLFGLRRIESGGFNVDEAMTLMQVNARGAMGLLDERIIDISDALDFPTLCVSDGKKDRVSDGIALGSADILTFSEPFSVGETVSLVNRSGDVLALGQALVESASMSEVSGTNVPIVKYLRVI